MMLGKTRPQSEFVRLLTQVERLEAMHRAGCSYPSDVDELFAIARECRSALDVASTVAAEPPRSPALFKPRDAEVIAAEAGAAVQVVLTQVLSRALAPGAAA